MDSPLKSRCHAGYNRRDRSCEDVFELAFADVWVRIVERKRLSRNAFSKCLLNRPPLRVVMVACGSAHHWARVFQAQGHAVRRDFYDGSNVTVVHRKAGYTNATVALADIDIVQTTDERYLCGESIHEFLGLFLFSTRRELSFPKQALRAHDMQDKDLMPVKTIKNAAGWLDNLTITGSL